MLERIDAPWTPEQVAALNAYQRRGDMHPFTCGGDRADAAHRRYAEEAGDGDWGVLVARQDGWVCPVCGYRQTWAHAFMAATEPEDEDGCPNDPP
jgi:hypothetical protein